MASSFPSGFTHGITVRGVPLTQAHPGQVFWVSNSSVLLPGHKTGSNGNPGTFTQPFSTLDYAVGRCVASRGDIIFVKPGHIETVSSATALALDVAGVAIIGLGVGTLRPKFTLDTANTATIGVSAANITVHNILFIGNFLSIASLFTLTTAPGFTLDSCEFRDTSATLGFLSILTTTVSVDANDLSFTRNRRTSNATTTPGAAITIAGTMTYMNISDNEFYHTVASTTAIVLTHGALVVAGLLMARNKVYCVNTANTADGILITTSATTGTGIIQDNVVRSQDPSATILVTAAAVQYGMFNNLHTGETTLASGFVLPAIGAD